MYPGFLAPQGFTACPWVTVGAELLQLLTLYGVYVLGKGLHRPCWPGWSARHLTQPRIKAYLKLYVPAALAIASDFWRMAFIGAVAAHQGSLNLAVFNASYRVNRSSTRALSSTPTTPLLPPPPPPPPPSPSRPLPLPPPLPLDSHHAMRCGVARGFNPR